MKTKSSTTRNSTNRAPLRYGLFLIPLALVCFALSPQARAVCQDACLTNRNTVQGDDALISNTTRTNNTANGVEALIENTTGDDNTANGVANAMLLNEFLKEHKTVQQQAAIIKRLQQQVEALSAGLQQVKAQVEATRLTPQVLASSQ